MWGEQNQSRQSYSLPNPLLRIGPKTFHCLSSFPLIVKMTSDGMFLAQSLLRLVKLCFYPTLCTHESLPFLSCVSCLPYLSCVSCIMCIMLTGDFCVFHPCVREGLVTESELVLVWTELLSQMPAALLDLCLVSALPAPSVLDIDSLHFHQEQQRKTLCMVLKTFTSNLKT